MDTVESHILSLLNKTLSEQEINADLIFGAYAIKSNSCSTPTLCDYSHIFIQKGGEELIKSTNFIYQVTNSLVDLNDQQQNLNLHKYNGLIKIRGLNVSFNALKEHEIDSTLKKLIKLEDEGFYE